MNMQEDDALYYFEHVDVLELLRKRLKESDFVVKKERKAWRGKYYLCTPIDNKSGKVDEKGFTEFSVYRLLLEIFIEEDSCVPILEMHVEENINSKYREYKVIEKFLKPLPLIVEVQEDNTGIIKIKEE